MKIALVHDYLTQRGGAERVFELLCKRYPDADIFTSLYDPQKSIDLGERIINTTFLQVCTTYTTSQHFILQTL